MSADQTSKISKCKYYI